MEPLRLLVVCNVHRGWLSLGSLAPGTTFHQVSYNSPPRTMLSVLAAGAAASATVSLSPKVTTSQPVRQNKKAARIALFIFFPPCTLFFFWFLFFRFTGSRGNL